MKQLVKKVLFFFIAALGLFSSCDNNLQERLLHLDSSGRGLAVKITSPNDRLNSLAGQIAFSAVLSDTQNDSYQIQLFNNNQLLQTSTQTQKNFTHNIALTSGANNLCIVVKTSIGQEVSHCIQVYGSLTATSHTFNEHYAGACASNNGILYCAGGVSNHNKLLIFDPQSNTLQIKTMNQSRKYHAVSFCNNKLYIIGGTDNSDVFPLENLVYDPQTDNFNTFMISPYNPARIYPAAVCHNNKVYVAGGGLGIPGYSFDILDTIDRYDPAANPLFPWTNITQRMNVSRASFMGFYDGRYFYAAGGFSTHGGQSTILSSLERLDLTNTNAGWQMLATMSSPRFLAGGGLLANRYYIALGGINFQEYVKTMERYDLLTNIWETIGTYDEVWSEAAISESNDKIYIVGGKNNHGQKTNRFYQFAPVFP
jgi:N-acetylneuraminic acid mutarotase